MFLEAFWHLQPCMQAGMPPALYTTDKQWADTQDAAKGVFILENKTWTSAEGHRSAAQTPATAASAPPVQQQARFYG